MASPRAKHSSFPIWGSSAYFVPSGWSSSLPTSYVYFYSSIASISGPTTP